MSRNLNWTDMILEEMKNINSSRAELKKFGKSVGLAFIIIGILFSLYAWRFFPVPIYIGAFLLLFSYLSPVILLPFQKVWMALAVILGFISTRVILAIIYYFILTPIAVIGRIAGKDFIDEKIDSRAKSYWSYRKPESGNNDNIKRQF